MANRSQTMPTFLLLLALSGCATLPTGPSVMVLPEPGKPFELFQSEDVGCRSWAERQVGVGPQQNYDQNLATGATVGTVIGAGIGALLGAASGHAGAGAAIGAGSGLLLGSASGADSGQVYGRQAQRRYDNAYLQCMYSYGNQVPGYRRRTLVAASQPIVAAPPPPAMAQADVPPPDLLPPPSDIPPPPPDLMPEPGQYQLPPEVYIDEAPRFIYSPALRMYVAVGVPYDLVYTGSDYFYFYGGRWYRGLYYNGPWVPATRRYFPPVLLRYRIDYIRRYRDVEFRRFERDRSHYSGRFHRPEFRGERRNPGRRDERR